jgi:hypothetical protein
MPLASEVLVEVTMTGHRFAAPGTNGTTVYAVTMSGESEVSELCFTEDIMANEELLHNLQRIREHGSVVVALPSSWRFENYPQGILSYILTEAVNTINRIPQQHAPEDGMQMGYDKVLAKEIMTALYKIYPKDYASPMNLKHAFDNKPNGDSLMTALDALYKQGLIDGRTAYESMSGEHRLSSMLRIRLTEKGVDLVDASAATPTVPNTTTNIYNTNNHSASGPNARIMVGVDNSQNNITITTEQVFHNLAEHIDTQVNDLNKVGVLREKLQALEDATDQQSAFGAYSSFIGSIADHLSLAALAAQYGPAIFHWIQNLPTS